MSEINSCLIEELKKIKVSANEAIEDLEPLSDFKEYMHVKRKVEGDLMELIKKSYELDKSQLILVCGNVGDGKSHIISYLKKHHSDILNEDNFYIHNDATESFSPKKTDKDTLKEKVLKDFSDKNLNINSQQKTILLINLGTLNNFIESEYEKDFKILKAYVKDKKILELSKTPKKENEIFDKGSQFQFINFSDYHLYNLTKEGPRSKYMEDLFNKVVQKKSTNIFYKKYKERCQSCKYKDKCPVKFNYEFLQDESIRKKIIDLLIQIMIKFKVIISTRDLLNFIYDIIVCSYNISTLHKDLKKDINFKRFIKYISTLIPMSLYEHEDLSFIFNNMSKLDPITIRTEELDEKIIRFNNIKSISEMFKEHINFEKYDYLKRLFINENILEEDCVAKNEIKLKQTFLKSFIRFYKFIPKSGLLNLKDDIYSNYMKDLYYWNKYYYNDDKEVKKNLKSLYNKVEDTIYAWNGRNLNKLINISPGKIQSDYIISKEVEIRPKLDKSFDKEVPLEDLKELHKFLSVFYLSYTADPGSNSTVSIDFSLYKLIEKINKGYRPNKKDRNNFVNFVRFIEELLESKNINDEMHIEHLRSEKKYKLVYNKEFEDYEFKEVK
ncbi:DNA phosphorothioation-dependent restriction protein DptF [Natroniella sulfidigena]|uniref:DNA phosphorothioation-dependent restriction protein DptF n=1 Tax=Natroniella sulfidigena TaxID=723921 RepID=UPI00200A4CFA|nr:DNA phosphorothioation-dependent restriction protein DptF [Natroniella sulfidigena]MCK8817153.1 DNA phosphorothioation-dependent restriction protein DptF [Natroniella sulfidigena]